MSYNLKAVISLKIQKLEDRFETTNRDLRTVQIDRIDKYVTDLLIIIEKHYTKLYIGEVQLFIGVSKVAEVQYLWRVIFK